MASPRIIGTPREYQVATLDIEGIKISTTLNQLLLKLLCRYTGIRRGRIWCGVCSELPGKGKKFLVIHSAVLE